MIIDCISDLHGAKPELEGGDLLIIAGDMTARDRVPEWCDFFHWIGSLNYRKIVYIGGNHDRFLEQSAPSAWARQNLPMCEHPAAHIEYLFDNFIMFEGLKIYGSPWVRYFKGMNKNCCAFTWVTASQLEEKWALIPDDVDILVTHTPPFGMMDKVESLERCGCPKLADRILELKKLKLHVFGHIHEGYGQCHEGYQGRAIEEGENFHEYIMDESNFIPIGHLSVNASIMDVDYQQVNKPIRVEI